MREDRLICSPQRWHGHFFPINSIILIKLGPGTREQHSGLHYPVRGHLLQNQQRSNGKDFARANPQSHARTPRHVSGFVFVGKMTFTAVDPRLGITLDTVDRDAALRNLDAMHASQRSVNTILGAWNANTKLFGEEGP